MAPRIGAHKAWLVTRIAFLGMLLVGCTQWQVQDISPQQLVATQHPNRMRVMRRDSTKVVLTDPEIVHDTLFGLEVGQSPASAHRDGIPLHDVAHVSVRKSDPVATGALIGLPVAALVGAALILRSEIINSAD